LGLLLTIGSFCGVLASLVVLPVILRMMTRPAAELAPAVARSSAA
jgi:predicted RND superfamily exporter protein